MKIKKQVVILSLFFCLVAYLVHAGVSSVTLPQTLNSYATPKVSYVDENDVALKNGINETIDTVNTYLNNGILGTKLLSSGDWDVKIDKDSNSTSVFSVTHHTSDTLFKVSEDSSVKVYGNLTMVGVVDSFTGSWQGWAGTSSEQVYYTLMGKTATLLIPTENGTSDSAGTTLTGLPSALYPKSQIYKPILAQNNNADTCGVVIVGQSDVIQFKKGFDDNGLWTASGIKGIFAFSISYIIND